MNTFSKDIFYKQARRQGLWAAGWLVLAVLAMITRPAAEGAQQWASEQLLLVSGLFVVFHFGRMFQCLFQMRTAPSPQAVPAWASLEAEVASAESGEISSSPHHHYHARDIRAFASVQEALEHGWEFDEPIAHFEGEDIPKMAWFNGDAYAFDGLAPDHIRGSVPASHRLFGRLSYKIVETETTKPPSPVSGDMITS